MYKFFAIGLGNVEHSFIHNSYLYVLSKMGLIGFGLFASVFLTAVTVWSRCLHHFKDTEEMGLALAFGLMLIVLMIKAFTTWQLNDLSLSLYVGCLLGVIGVFQSWVRKEHSA
jgi:O-antigen ligase